MGVTVTPEIFDLQGVAYPDGQGWETSPAFLVVTDDRLTAAAALHAAGDRFMKIDENGDELADWELEVDDTYTPNGVSAVHLADEGPVLSVDTKGELSVQMGDAMVRVLVAELTVRGVTAHVTAPPRDCSWVEAPQWAPPGEPIAESTVAHRWFITRTVFLTTTTGRPYVDTEYRAPDGSWVPRRTEAEHYQDAPVAFILSLRAEPVPSGRGQIECLLLPVDDSEWQPLPPESIRQPG